MITLIADTILFISLIILFCGLLVVVRGLRDTRRRMDEVLRSNEAVTAMLKELGATVFFTDAFNEEKKDR